jgi:hypothetical protein
MGQLIVGGAGTGSLGILNGGRRETAKGNVRRATAWARSAPVIVNGPVRRSIRRSWQSGSPETAQ